MTPPAARAVRRFAIGSIFGAALALGCHESDTTQIRSRAVSQAEMVEPSEPWDLLAIDRTDDGRVWALGRDGLYHWSEGESVWTMAHALRLHGRYPDLAVAPDGRSAVISTTTSVVRRREGASELTTLPLPDGFELWDARGDLWFAVRNEIEPDVRAELGPHTSAGYPADGRGWWYELACSVDHGATWSVVDRFDGAHCIRFDEQADGRLTILLGSLGVRAGTIEVDGASAVVAHLETLVAPRRLPLPGVTFLGEWLLMDGPTGRIGISGHYASDGAVSYQSKDGGFSWSPVEEEHCLSVTCLRLGDGRVLRLREYLDDVEWSLERWTGDAFERVAVPSGADDVRIAFAEVDASGALLLLLDSGVLWTLPQGSSEWEPLWESLPGRARIASY